MGKLLDLLTFKDLKGSRTQITIIIMGIINILVQLGVISLTAEDLAKINQGLIWAGTYFFAEKVSK